MNNSNNTQTIICNLLRYKDKVKILQKANQLRGTNIFINKDFSEEMMKLRKQLWEEVKPHRDKGRVALILATELLYLTKEGVLQNKLTSLTKCYIKI